ncbi:DUF4236 domain-containing protein [Bibersteinia trehalosi]|uniref:DUF4236 domain-containing protein n=1 Tax=Bibersteinia trehalosi TaxID=47735 RepID=A0A426FIS7_BIBTR|nr:DUF4236 domain-containing protein [Bibersteinia trehalosi]RRN04666.1 DUF4236 domain-containing protein [Bibersteinia trehalosi]
MAFKFRKRIKIAPGITLNLSKKGVSTTIGGKGASVNIGKKGAYLNTSIPGTGFYDRRRLDSQSQEQNDNIEEPAFDWSLPKLEEGETFSGLSFKDKLAWILALFFHFLACIIHSIGLLMTLSGFLIKLTFVAFIFYVIFKLIF